jgi:hypothetical protein
MDLMKNIISDLDIQKRDKKKENQLKFIEEALAIEVESAREAGMIGYMARSLVQATLPHSKREGNEFKRTNGIFTMTIMTPTAAGGLPYGSIPRLLNFWITTEAVLTRSPILQLGPTLSSFMMQLDLIPTGGRWGTITRLKEQMVRLFSSYISCVANREYETQIKNVLMVHQANLWWHPKNPDQSALWQSTVELNQNFFEEIIQSPVPIHIQALKLLKRSPMALDIYSWLTYRMSYLRSRTCIPWRALELQFGADYKETRVFKHKFCQQLKKVLTIYQNAKVEPTSRGLLLKPSPTHIAKRSY